jgi:signal transduction histidine kinase
MWLLQFLAVYILWDIGEHAIIEYTGSILLGTLFDWVGFSIIAAVFMLRLSARVDKHLQYTERLDNERAEARRAAHQLEAVQSTARAVAHNLNQPLTAILGYLALIQATPREERDDDDLARIHDEVERVATLVRQFQQVSRYRTISYAGGAQMLDISSGGDTNETLYS